MDILPFDMESVFRLIITFEFAMMAIVGIAVAANLVAMDAIVRRMSKEQTDIILGLQEGMRAAQEAKEAKKRERLAQILAQSFGGD